MQLLFSNYPPLKTSNDTFSNAFYHQLTKASGIDIAVGYISRDSLTEILYALKAYKNIHSCNLIIGMHYFEQFTRLQYSSALNLNQFLQSKNYGAVYLVKAFAYHGKMYSYTLNGTPISGIIGSDNLSSLIPGGRRRYESSVLFEENTISQEIHQFITQLKDKASINISDAHITNFKEENPLLDELENVQKISESELEHIKRQKTNITFDIPIKTTPCSNLNAFFGKGRQSLNGIIKPRHWYEVELIVPAKISNSPDYPKANSSTKEFTVFTDDGWSFKCYVSGNNNKNFRSKDDLTILGKWIKGRLENAGALEIGSPLTDETLKKYGRRTFEFTKLTGNNMWFIDFGVPNVSF